MAQKGYFLDNVKYGADDFNEAFSHLVTAGVSSFAVGDSITQSTSDAIADVVSDGVDNSSPQSCMVTESDGVYTVQPGTCWLADGSFCVIDSGGVEGEVTEAQVNYVYVEHNRANNTVGVVFSDSPGNSDTVPLATINEDGSITDTRKFAYIKVAANAALTNTYTERTNFGNGKYDGTWYIGVDQFVSTHKIRFVIFYGDWWCVMKFGENTTSFEVRTSGKAQPSKVRVTINGLNVSVDFMNGSGALPTTMWYM